MGIVADPGEWWTAVRYRACRAATARDPQRPRCRAYVHGWVGAPRRTVGVRQPAAHAEGITMIASTSSVLRCEKSGRLNWARSGTGISDRSACETAGIS